MNFINRLIDFSLRNRLVILLAALLVIAGGVYTTKKMDVDVFPDLTAPTVVIMTEGGIGDTLPLALEGKEC